MAKILILESNSPEFVKSSRAKGENTGSDLYASALQSIQTDVEISIVEPYAAPLSLDDLDWADGFVFTGAGVNWSTDAPEAAPLREAGALVLDSGKPVVGSCNGLQLAAVLLGGSVGASPNGLEIGLAQGLSLTDPGKSHTMMEGRIDGFCVPCVHRDEVQRIPEGAVLIASNSHSPVQAMTYERNGVDFWGMQYHPELSADNIADYVSKGEGIFSSGSNLAGDLRAAERDPEAASRLGAQVSDLEPGYRTLELRNWLAHVKEVSKA